MCGRFTQLHTWEELHAWFSLSGPVKAMPARYNVAPGQQVAILRSGDDGLDAVSAHWGLIPGWARDASRSHGLINARVETARQKPSFRTAWRDRRCVIPASGFYEWYRQGRSRQPWYFSAGDGSPLALAGLWERWRVPDQAPPPGGLIKPGDMLESFTILTMPANPCVHPVHPRMPVILNRHEVRPWLSRCHLPEDPFPAGHMNARAVSRHVNSPRNDDPRCLDPAPTGPDFGLFAPGNGAA